MLNKIIKSIKSKYLGNVEYIVTIVNVSGQIEHSLKNL
jgi:hypothetical protein